MIHTVSVIISTYNQPEWLQKALWGFEIQTYREFDIIIADDGSGTETEAVVIEFQKRSKISITHVWQKDEGFRKTRILNKAILATTSDYLIFTDGDCIPRQDLVAQHMKHRKKGYFLSGGYFKLPMALSKAITKKDILSQRIFDTDWLVLHGVKDSFKLNKLNSYGYKARLLNFLTPTKATWDGNNASGWRDDILAVNGFDERMQYGGEDRELGERLMHHGIRPVQLRYSAITLHLDHERGYVTEAMIENNKTIRKATKEKQSTWTPFGIIKQEQDG